MGSRCEKQELKPDLVTDLTRTDGLRTRTHLKEVTTANDADPT